jgi:hypothetical protein
MHVELGGDVPLDLVEEAAELAGAVAIVALADDDAGGDVEGGEQRGRAVAGVVVAATRRLAGAHRQHPLAAVQRLDLRFLVDARRTMARSGGAR